jgi:hypothetical protein
VATGGRRAGRADGGLGPGPVAGASARGPRAAAQALRRVGNGARRLWIVCLGDRRYRYGREPPRAAGEAMPLEEALDLADSCLNPLGFLTGTSRCGPPYALGRRRLRSAPRRRGPRLRRAGLTGLERPVVAIAWVVSVATGLAAELGREREPRCEDADRRAG